MEPLRNPDGAHDDVSMPGRSFDTVQPRYRLLRSLFVIERPSVRIDLDL
jgi:hypothetical protein